MTVEGALKEARAEIEGPEKNTILFIPNVIPIIFSRSNSRIIQIIEEWKRQNDFYAIIFFNIWIFLFLSVLADTSKELVAAERKGAGEARGERSHYKLHWWDIMRQSLGPPREKEEQGASQQSAAHSKRMGQKMFQMWHFVLVYVFI